MVVACVAYDLTRLFVGPRRPPPRGIDRVELGYAKHFLSEWPGEAIATLPTPAGVRTISRANAMRIIAAAEHCWGEDVDPDNDPLLDRLGERLCARGGRFAPIRGHVPSARWASGLARVARQAGCLLGPKAHEAVPRNAVYLNVGQFGVAFPGFVGWLQRRPDITAVFMLHDVIPLDHPDFVPASSVHFHRQMVKNVANHASGVITTTRAAASAVRRELQNHTSDVLPVLTQPLPVAPAFLARQNIMPRLAQVPYFVVLGSVEPRKNHLLLLNVWRELAQGPAAPKLVIAGSRWNGHEPVTAMLKTDPCLNRSVIEISDLPTPSLSRVLANAKGVLMPSLAEGFGLPIIEAMALGVPVIASDIPAHREAGGTYATYISPHDVSGWLTAVKALGMPGRERTEAGRGAPVTWPFYLRRVEQFLELVHARQDEPANTEQAGLFAA